MAATYTAENIFSDVCKAHDGSNFLATCAITPIRWARLAFLSACMAAIGGCAKPPAPPPAPPPPTIIQATLNASEVVNPDGRGRASPILVRVFELKTLAAFDAADFFSIWEREQETLGAELAAREEIQLRPGESTKLLRTTNADTRHFAVVAAYRDLERSTWRAAVAVMPNQTNVISVDLDARKLSIARR
jgi:type VI secretion system protein VasD